jgi:hypothetical protein
MLREFISEFLLYSYRGYHIFLNCITYMLREFISEFLLYSYILKLFVLISINYNYLVKQ